MSAEKSVSEVYEDRNVLAFAFARSICTLGETLYDLGVLDECDVYDAGWYLHDEWAVVFVELPEGQVSWHVRPEDVPEWLMEHDPSAFDGHTREEKNERLLEFARSFE